MSIWSKLGWMVVIFLGGVLAATAAIADPAKPFASNDPWRDPRIPTALSAFFGNHNGAYIEVGGSLLHQFQDVFWGIPNPSLRLSDGSLFLSASRRGEAEEKAAIVLDVDGTIKAAALVSFRCLEHGSVSRSDAELKKKQGLYRHGDTLCMDDKSRTMTIFVKEGHLAPSWQEAFATWKIRIGKDESMIDPSVQPYAISLEQVSIC